MRDLFSDLNALHPDELEQLLWECAEDELSPAEQERLQAHLDVHPEWATRFGEIADLNRELAAVPEKQPPAELRRRIHRALPPAARPAPLEAGSQHGDWRQRLRRWLSPSPAWGLAYLAAGLVIGLLAQPLVSRLDAVPAETAVGTVRPPAADHVLTVPGPDATLVVTVRDAFQDTMRLTVTLDGEPLLEERLVLPQTRN